MGEGYAAIQRGGVVGGVGGSLMTHIYIYIYIYLQHEA
jgi:hypothetical protein